MVKEIKDLNGEEVIKLRNLIKDEEAEGEIGVLDHVLSFVVIIMMLLVICFLITLLVYIWRAFI